MMQAWKRLLPMLSDAPHISLIGRTSSWRLHLPSTAAGKAHQVTRSSALEAPLLVTWLRHQRYGLLGVYVPNGVNVGGIERRRGAWVRVTGNVRPCRTQALPDDPRSALAPTEAPLLLALTSIESSALPPAGLEQPILLSAHSVRISSGQQVSSGRVGCVAGWPDAVVWQTNQASIPVFAPWNRIHGVVTWLGKQRYLRYVLRYVSQ